MTDLFIAAKKTTGKRSLKSKRRNRKNFPSTYNLNEQNEDSNNVYSKAVHDYEEFKRISKNNIHESREETNSLSIKGDSNVKSIEGKPLNNAGKSVLTYKKLVSCIKSPYITGSVIENLNKAYYPSKIKKSKQLNKRKKKSSTPNIKVRKYQKDFLPVRLQQKIVGNQETAELERLQFLKQREEYEILLRQKHNIQQLKDIQNGVVPEDPVEEDNKSRMESRNESQQNDTSAQNESKTDTVIRQSQDNQHIGNDEIEPNETTDVYLYKSDKNDIEGSKNDESADVQTVINVSESQKAEYLAASAEVTEEKTEVLIQENDNEEADEDDQENDITSNEPQSAEKPSTTDQNSNIFLNRSKSDQVDEVPTNLVIFDSKDTPLKSSSTKKKSKAKTIPKTI